MFALLANPLIRDAMIGLVLLAALASGYGYYRWSQAEMDVLKANVATVQHQADDLVIAKQKQDKDLAAIKTAQDAASLAITHARDQAAQAARTLRNTQTTRAVSSNPRALQTQINTEQAATLQALEALSQ
jgi:hypothetical protein